LVILRDIDTDYRCI